jgi:hypothetical protein
MGRGGGSTGITMAGFLVGAIFGAGVALLLAPAPGGETRRRLGDTARRLGDAASEAVDRARHGEGGESRPGGRSSREPLAGGRTPQTGTPGTTV